MFYDNLEDVINKQVSLQDDIARYQSVLKYARSSLDYSVGKGLNMLPLDMLLKLLNQVIDGYNDNIVVNTSGHALGRVIDHVKPVPHVKTSLKQERLLLDVQALSRPLEAHNDEKTV